MEGETIGQYSGNSLRAFFSLFSFSVIMQFIANRLTRFKNISVLIKKYVSCHS